MPRLTNLQKEFINQYFICGRNATEAIMRAGYKAKDRATAAAMGYENLRKPHISEAIEERLKESAMGANEVLFLLSDHARANVDDFVDMFGIPSIEKARATGKTHLIKKIKTKTTYIKRYNPATQDFDEDTVVETEMELHDAQSALVQLGRFHKLFTDKVEFTDWRGEAIAAIRSNEVDYESIAEELGEDLASQLFREAGVQIPRTKNA
jgi:hypothetical protein